MAGLSPCPTNQIEKIALRSVGLGSRLSVLFNQFRPGGPGRNELAHGNFSLLRISIPSRSDSTDAPPARNSME